MFPGLVNDFLDTHGRALRSLSLPSFRVPKFEIGDFGVGRVSHLRRLAALCHRVPSAYALG